MECRNETSNKPVPHRTSARLAEVIAAFLRLGCISFGGPVAHIGYMREEFVRRRQWIDDMVYSDLVALCQFLPGPTSSQVVFALGMTRAGVIGALLASVCFTMPSAILMVLFAYGVSTAASMQRAGLLHGLKLAAAAVVAQAVWGMWQKLCPDLKRAGIAVSAAAAVLFFPNPAIQVVMILTGALIGSLLYRGKQTAPALSHPGKLARHHAWAAATLAVFFVLLVSLPGIAAANGGMSAHLFDSFYRAGSMVFGGGHVVLPLLRAELVPPGWITDNAFLAGYGAVQAVPGPLFTFAAYLGTVINSGNQAWVGGLWCLFAIFLPSWLLIGGTLPFWDLIRSRTWAQAALCGANASVVGILLAALYNPVWKEGVTSSFDVAIVLLAFAMLGIWRFPPWLVVVLAAGVGQWLL